MYIKKVVVNNFKSYKEAVAENLSPGLNVIVGKNGSGKSNFLSAIQCVLSPESYSWRADEKMQYINNEEEPTEGSATIEIIFDNKSLRLPIPKDEVSLKRVLNSKKDSFFIDYKPVSKQEMLNFLESIGFSKCNPYNIVKQGKVTELALATDSKRYNLLIDISGVKIYNEKREESIKLLNDASEQRTKIRQYINDLVERIRILDDEKQEMADYNRREKEKNKIEHVIYQRERSHNTRKLDSLNDEKNDFLKSLSVLQENTSTCEKELEYSEKSLSDKTYECINLDTVQSQLMQKLNSCLESKSRLELEIHVLKSSCSEFNQSKGNYKDQLTAIAREIKEKESKLQLLKTELHDSKELEALVKERLKSNFSSSFTQDSISTESSIDTTQTQSFSQKINNLKYVKQDLSEKLLSVENKMSNSGMLIFQSTNKRSELIEHKKQLWSRESGLNVNIQEISQKLSQFEKKLNHIIPKDIVDGLKSLQIILSDTPIVGVYGPLFENFDAETHFFTAIEVTAGIKLFNILVDNSKIATNILKRLKERRLEGQLTFMPLDQLCTRSHSLPELENAIPLISKIIFDARFEKAFKLVFEHTLLCRDKQVALTVSRNYNLDGVTLDGDQVHHKGSIIGGYMEQKNKAIDIYSNIKILKQELTDKNNDISSITEQINKINEEINEISIFLQNEHLNNNQLKREYEKLKSEIININSEFSLIESESYKVNQNKSSQSHNLSSTLPPNIDASTINNLSFDRLEEKLREIILNSCKVVSQINSIESSLNNHLYIVHQELKQKISELSLTDSENLIESKSIEFSSVLNQIDQLNAQLIENQSKMDQTKSMVSGLESTIENLKVKINEFANEQSKLFSELESITNKTSLIKRKLTEAEAKINTFAFAEEDTSSLNEKSIKWLWKQLNTYSIDLKKNNINKKAAEEFLQLSNDRDKFEIQFQDLDQSLNAIQDLITKLDAKKNDAIAFTFKQVSYHFSNIFSQLLPEARANLVLKRNPTIPNQPILSEDVSAYSEVGIKVSFNKNEQDFVEIGQLSGGQKSLVTLALIFAFQKCDPVPFYLFDEVDQALDPFHRQTFADMLGELSKKGQFIVTTFKPELLKYNPKCFKINFKQRVSNISSLSVDKAKTIFQSQA